MPLSDTPVAELARAYGIATQFWDWKGRQVDVAESTIVAVLRAMDVDAASPEAAEAALADLRLRPWRRPLPPCVVMEQGSGRTVEVHVPAGSPAVLHVRLEDGDTWSLNQVDNWEPDREVDQTLVGEASFWLPADLPLGYHRLHLAYGDRGADSTLIVSPHFLGFPASMGDRRAWGYAAQLYSVRSAESWGIGDLGDLADIATWSATQQFASFVLINPLHASVPRPPLEPSPYLPVSRRFVNPIYIRIENVAEYARLSDADRDRIAQLKVDLETELVGTTQLQRDQAWSAKLHALRIVHAAGLSPARLMSLQDFSRREGRGLTQFATWCALVDRYGVNWRSWPAEYRRPASPKVSEFAAEHAEEVGFYVWLQWLADDQLRAAQSAAKNAGMRIGIMNDLAVGVGAMSAEAWSLRDVFATGVSVGAPPDPFNQTGQDWGQLPWRPDRLDDLAYGPFRAMVSGILRHSGGIRVDHVMGLFRLWWIPEGGSPKEGTYVRFNHEAMVGILALEAHRAGALVVGEDLGTVEPWVRTYLRDRGILGTSILWFENGPDGQPLPPEEWREYCLASVTTHDLPPSAGYLAGDHVRLRHRLGLLTESLEDELAHAEAEQAAWLENLRSRELLAPGADDVEDIVLALHRFLTFTPARVLCAALTDAVGDRLTQNQPGTVNEYPNWRVPLSGPDGLPMSLERVFTSERALRLSAVMNRFHAPPIKPRGAKEEPKGPSADEVRAAKVEKRRLRSQLRARRRG